MESRIIISSEKIKPSSPTPRARHLQIYRLSMVDQVVPPNNHVPILLYYQPSAANITQETQSLKRSLSLILTRFYPLAGRANDDGQSIDCNDDGVPFIVAKFPGHRMKDIVKNSDPDLPHRLFLPCDVTAREPNLMWVQVNHFDCGGIAFAVVFSHLISDAVTMLGFLKAWGEANRGTREPFCPNFIAQILFPHKNGLRCEFLPLRKTGGRSVLRHYVFNAAAVSSLKLQSAADVDRPTRVEVVSAHIWKYFITAALANGVAASTAFHAVNLRRKIQPPLPSDCIGNLVWPARATTETGLRKGVGDLAREIRDSIKEIDSDFVNKMIGDEGLAGYKEILNRTTTAPVAGGVGDIVFFTSWCGLGAYSPDFGWGKPVWVNKCDAGSEMEVSNQVLLIDTTDGDGVEAWVVVDEQYAAVFDGGEELRRHATPLGIGPMD